MATIHPRIVVYLPKHVAATVRRLAGLRGVSRSAVVRDFLIEAQPVLDRVSNLLDLAARSDRTALKEWAKDLETVQGELETSLLSATATMDDLAKDMSGRPTAGRRRRPRRTPGQ
jgi:hypothetical protein